MNNKRLAAGRLTAGCVLALSSGLALTGCGGGGGGSSSPSSPGSGSGATTQQALASLNAITVTNTNGLSPTSQQLGQQLGPVVQQFQGASDGNPSDLDAKVGLAITQAAAAASNAGVTLGQVPAVAGAAQTRAVPSAARLAQVLQSLLIWNLAGVLGPSGPGVLPQPADLVPAPTLNARATSGGPTPAQVAQVIAALDSNLAIAEGNLTGALNAIGSNNDYVFGAASGKPVQIPVPDSSGTPHIEYIGRAELQTLAGAIAAVRAIANVAVAYDTDPGTFNFSATLLPQFQSSFAAGGSLGPSQYLPQNAFLTLTPNGAQRTRTALSELQAVATDATAGLQTIGARLAAKTNTQFLLSGSAFSAQSQLDLYQGYISSYKTDVSSTAPQPVPVSIGGQKFTVNLNLPGFLTNPPTDLKPLAPVYQLSGPDANGNYTATLSLNGKSYPVTVTSTTTVASLLGQSAYAVILNAASSGSTG